MARKNFPNKNSRSQNPKKNNTDARKTESTLNAVIRSPAKAKIPARSAKIAVTIM